jgi:hypothetical protein
MRSIVLMLLAQCGKCPPARRAAASRRIPDLSVPSSCPTILFGRPRYALAGTLRTGRPRFYAGRGSFTDTLAGTRQDSGSRTDAYTAFRGASGGRAERPRVEYAICKDSGGRQRRRATRAPKPAGIQRGEAGAMLTPHKHVLLIRSNMSTRRRHGAQSSPPVPFKATNARGECGRTTIFLQLWSCILWLVAMRMVRREGDACVASTEELGLRSHQRGVTRCR